MNAVARRTATVERAASHRVLLWTIGLLSALVLIITADDQIYDNNFYTLSETVSLFAGDHPYRDFFEWGVPLQAALSYVTQLLFGHRLLGEFINQWALMIAGMVVAAHLAVRLSRSVVTSTITMIVAVINLAVTPTVHYSKLFIYPCAILLMWRYLERPGVRRSGAMGMIAAVAFLLRHDHGLYVGGGVLLTLALARLTVPESRGWRRLIEDVLACGGAAAVLVLPWAAVVQSNEGLFNYVLSRAYLNAKWASHAPFTNIFNIDPLSALTPEPWKRARRTDSGCAPHVPMDGMGHASHDRSPAGDGRWPSSDTVAPAGSAAARHRSDARCRDSGRDRAAMALSRTRVLRPRSTLNSGIRRPPAPRAAASGRCGAIDGLADVARGRPRDRSGDHRDQPLDSHGQYRDVSTPSREPARNLRASDRVAAGRWIGIPG
jgi:hypothetical protein